MQPQLHRRVLLRHELSANNRLTHPVRLLMQHTVGGLHPQVRIQPGTPVGIDLSRTKLVHGEVHLRRKQHALALTVDRQPVDDMPGSVDGVVVDVDAGPAAVTQPVPQHALEPLEGLLGTQVLSTHRNYLLLVHERFTLTNAFGVCPRRLELGGYLFGLGQLRPDRVSVVEVYGEALVVARLLGDLLLQLQVGLEVAVGEVLVDLLEHRHHVDLLRRAVELGTGPVPTIVLTGQVVSQSLHLALGVRRAHPLLPVSFIQGLHVTVDLHARCTRILVRDVVELVVHRVRRIGQGVLQVGRG